MVKPGYKQTEIGEIPEDWGMAEAAQLMRIETGSKNTEDKIDDGRFPFFVRSPQVERINSYHYDCEAVLTAGDGVGTGKTFHYYNGKFDAHQRVYVMSQFNGIHAKFFYYYFSENFGSEVAKYTAKSSVDSVRRPMIAEMNIPLPAIREQQRIAEALSDVDALIASLEKLIAKKKAIKQGAMQRLLTGKTRLPGFEGKLKKTELGEIPEDWEVTPLKQLYNITSSKRVFQSEWKNSGVPFYRAREIAVMSEGKTPSKELLYISEEMYNSYTSQYGAIRENDILITGVGTLGKVYVVQASDKFYFKDGNIIWLQWKGESCSRFIKYLYDTPLLQHQVQDNSGGSTVGTYTISNAKETLIPNPSLPEQNAIAAVLADLDAELESLSQELAKTRQLKQGMMQQLLTGRIRISKQGENNE